MSPMPTKSEGKSSQSPNTFTSGRTYLSVATLPRSTKRHRPPTARTSDSACSISGSVKAGLRASMSTADQARRRARSTVSSGARSPSPGADDVHARQPLGGLPEGPRVGELAPEVQAADEAEQLAERRATGPDLLGEGEGRPLAEEQSAPLTPQAGG